MDVSLSLIGFYPVLLAILQGPIVATLLLFKRNQFLNLPAFLITSVISSIVCHAIYPFVVAGVPLGDVAVLLGAITGVISALGWWHLLVVRPSEKRRRENDSQVE